MTNEEKLQSYRETNDIVFGNKWFEKHQSKLLFLLNNQLTKRWFRWCLRIRQCDISLSTDIVEIAPNRFSWGTSEKKTTDFRTHDKFSKRLYSAFKPFWYLLHAIDWAMFDRYEELAKLSFGFSTLTAYTGWNTSPMSGTVWRSSYGSNESWATLKAGAGNNNDIGDGSVIAMSIQDSTDIWYSLKRSIFCFDTSSLPDDATISATVMSLYSAGKGDNCSITPNVDVYTATPGSTSAPANSDYGQIGTTSQTGSPITYANWTASQYNDFTFNSTGIGNVSKTGISKFGCRNATYDAGSTTPTWSSGSNRASYLSATFGGVGTSQDPKLVVTYTTVVAPTVTTQAATNITKNSFTGNGNITATGGTNATRRGFCYKVGTSGDPTIADSIAYDDGDFGTGAFTKNIT